MTFYRLGGNAPTLAPHVRIAPSAQVMGNVHQGTSCSVWYGAVVRADNQPMRIGAGSNVRDGALLHSDAGYPLTIGENISVEHQVMLHGCTVGDGSLIGIGAVVLNGARIGKNCLVAAGALVTEGKHFPDGSLIVGRPATVKRALSLNRWRTWSTAHSTARPTSAARLDA